MRLHLTKAEAQRIVSALMTAPGQEPIDLILVDRIEGCMAQQKPFPKNPPDES